MVVDATYRARKGMYSMTKQEKIGLGLLVLLFVLFVGILVVTVKPFDEGERDFETNIFVEQRMKNLQRSQ